MKNGSFGENGSYGETFSPCNSNSSIASTAACHWGGYGHPAWSNLHLRAFRARSFLGFLQEDLEWMWEGGYVQPAWSNLRLGAF